MQSEINYPSELEPKIVRANIDWVLDQVAAGRPEPVIAEELGVSTAAITGLRRRNSKLRTQFRTARAMAAHGMAEDMLEIADELALNPDVDRVAAADRRIRVRQWLIARWAPDEYSDPDKRQQAPSTTTVNVGTGGLHLAAVKGARGQLIEGETVDDTADNGQE